VNVLRFFLYVLLVVTWGCHARVTPSFVPVPPAANLPKGVPATSKPLEALAAVGEPGSQATPIGVAGPAPFIPDGPILLGWRTPASAGEYWGVDPGQFTLDTVSKPYPFLRCSPARIIAIKFGFPPNLTIAAPGKADWGSVLLFRNGLLQSYYSDFTITGSDDGLTITLVPTHPPWNSDDMIQAVILVQ
jgi:hypothetical protein